MNPEKKHGSRPLITIQYWLNHLIKLLELIIIIIIERNCINCWNRFLIFAITLPRKCFLGWPKILKFEQNQPLHFDNILLVDKKRVLYFLFWKYTNAFYFFSEFFLQPNIFLFFLYLSFSILFYNTNQKQLCKLVILPRIFLKNITVL